MAHYNRVGRARVGPTGTARSVPGDGRAPFLTGVGGVVRGL